MMNDAESRLIRFLSCVVPALLLLSVPFFPAQAFPCRPVAEDLSFDMPCVEFQGISYAFRLVFDPRESDPGGAYWRLDLDTLRILDSPPAECLPLKGDLRLYVSCAEYLGVSYRFSMDYAPETSMPRDLFWRMETETFSEVPEPPGYGTGTVSIGEEAWNTTLVYYTPENIRERANPGLLLYLHGDGESGVYSMTRRIETDFKDVADKKGLVVAAVQANDRGFQMVDAFGKYMTDDYFNTVDAVRGVRDLWPVNPYETYITGYSAGGPGAVMVARGQLRPHIRAVNIWCAPMNIYALIPNEYAAQVPVRVVSNSGDPNYYSSWQVAGASGNGSFGYWQTYLGSYGHETEVFSESHIYGHQFDSRSVGEAVGWMLETGW